MSSVNLQPSFDDLGVPLADVTFVVVDLETTGGSADAEITEVGAVKVRGGEVQGEFQSLVRPTTPIPPMIQVLTGITNHMVAAAPPASQVLPAFAEFAAGSVIVAHNARFDTGFLRRGYEQLGLSWPRPTVIDTVAVARTALLRDEVPNCKLATLARYFRSSTEPNHRALSDARCRYRLLTHRRQTRRGRRWHVGVELDAGCTQDLQVGQHRLQRCLVVIEEHAGGDPQRMFGAGQSDIEQARVLGA